MSSLVIEYQLDTKQPGYAFRPPTNGYHDALLKAIWRQAMPRGHGWGAGIYENARTFKCFPAMDGLVAISETTVTDQQDEHGRRGIRRAEINLVPSNDISGYLRACLDTYPDQIRAAAHAKLTVGRWGRVVESALPRLTRPKTQIVLAYPYAGPETWEVVEVIVLLLANAWLLRAIPGWGQNFSFTTLALTNEDESRIVAVPLDKARQMQNVPVINIA